MWLASVRAGAVRAVAVRAGAVRAGAVLGTLVLVVSVVAAGGCRPAPLEGSAAASRAPQHGAPQHGAPQHGAPQHTAPQASGSRSRGPQAGSGAGGSQPGASPARAAAARAAAAAGELATHYGAHAYRGARRWQAANALAALAGYMRATGSRTYLTQFASVFQAYHRAGGFLNGYYDDEGWWALTWIAAYDLTGDAAYLRQARGIFADMTGGWDGTCGGGIWWDKARTYKNAIANEIFLDVAALLHSHTPGDRDYERWADREWRWFRGSGMLTGAGLVVDGLADCRPILSSPTWTYNQGVLIGGLVRLAAGTHDPAPLRTARKVAGAVIHSHALSPGGVLREPCEPSACGIDPRMFKGIFVTNLKILYERVPDPAYRAYLSRNARRLWAADRRGSSFGLRWAGPFGSAGVATQASALDLLSTQA